MPVSTMFTIHITIRSLEVIVPVILCCLQKGNAVGFNNSKNIF